MKLQSRFAKVVACCGLVIMWSVLAVQRAESETLRVVQGSHPLDEYAVGALRVAVAQLDESYTVQVLEQQLTQTRVGEELRAGKLDVMWLAANRDAESALLPVRFPLLKGLLGYRICIINPGNQGAFRGVRNMADLKALQFGQGHGWPDVDILRTNGLDVVVTSKYENLFHMTDGGRFDGFPRGVLEPWSEIQSHRDLDLTVDSEVLMIYTLPFYFFVEPTRAALAGKLQLGLERALTNGAFDRYFFGHQMIRDALAKSRLENRTVFRLQNPTLSEHTPLQRADYWFDITER